MLEYGYKKQNEMKIEKPTKLHVQELKSLKRKMS